MVVSKVKTILNKPIMGTTGQSITLANSIIGVGILAMPFCFQQCGVLLATLILLFMGLVSRLCCHFLLKSALLARRRNFEFLAFHVFGQAGKFAVEVGIIGFLMGTCIAYFVVVGDLGPQIVAKMFNINQSDILRTSIMVIVSLVCVLPLGLLRNVDSLSNVSAATIAFYFCLVMKVIFEAGAVMMTSDWNQRVEMWRPAGLLQCVPIFSMALFCQTQLFEIFESLPTLSLEKMNIVTKNAINICTAVYFTLGVFGYIAFSSHVISGNILMSLSPTMASDVIKLGFVMSLAFSFPLIIFPCRASLYSFLYKKVHSSHHDHIINHSIPETTFRCITVAIVAVALFISLLIPNIELVLGLVGSTIGVLICVVFPAACFIYVTFKNTNERILAKSVLVLGLVIMVLGTYANLQVAESSIEHYDDKYTQERIDKIVEDFFENRDKDDVYLKPPPSNDVQKEPPDSVVVNKERKDSEVQPPNPVPPESQSNEKMTLTKNAIKTDEKDVLQVPETKESVDDKVSETHPRNLKTKLESKLANGVNNGVAQKPKEDKPQSNEDKIDMIKQQKLIETIKQHGEEQKELIKEQKEILDEILKTKKELQQNKNEAVEANEAKKLAVESIKQIADMAIKSIGGVSEKPELVKKDEKVEKRLEKLTNDAVQEIAKKAVETIEAIQDIKEKPEQPNVAPPVLNSQPNAQPNILENPAQNVQSNQNAQANQNVQAEVPVNPPIPEGDYPPVVRTKDEAPIVAANVDPQANSNINNQNNAAVVQNVANNNVNQNSGVVAQNNIAPNVNPQPKQEVKPVVNEILNQNAPIPYNNVQKPPEIVKAPLNLESDAVKQHSHSPDEPQSYKQGEDTQVKPETKIVQNVPLPIVNELANNQMKIDKKPAAQKLSDDIQVNVPPKVENNGANNANVQENVPVANAQPQNVNSAPVRQKREVIDCTEKVSLKPEDKAICKNVVDENMKDSEVQLPNPVSLTKNTIKTDEKEILQVPETKESETHLKTKLQSVLANSDAQKPKEDIPQSNKDKIAIMQQKLTETIKQHGEKQKEMTKEQKEILDEILKTKKEPQQNKEAAEAKETKKIALQSIKQIADMAFKSIGGVSEIQEQAYDAKEEKRLEKLTNDAVQDIAKKTVEKSKLLNGFSNGNAQTPTEGKPIIITEQQKLIETIKKHGEKQKELKKEQKEILKTKKELQQVKNEASEAKEAKKKAIQNIRQINNANNGNLQENVPQIVNPVPIGQKREVIDCTEKVSLKPEDKAICRNLVDKNVKDSGEILPKSVDINEIALPKTLPIAANILHHISRQLKSFDKDER